MGQLNGFFELRTPRDLLAKLEADFARLISSEPTGIETQYAALDFFVCAEHLPEWVANANGQKASDLRNYPDGALVSHIANGAKHFRVTHSKHVSARQTRVDEGSFQSDAFQSSAFQVGRLVIEKESGGEVEVQDLARRVLEYWKAELP